MERQIDRIVLTGGTAAERDEAVRALRTRFEQRGFAVFEVPSAQEELRRAGVCPEDVGSAAAYAWLCLDLQLSREAVYIAAAGLAAANKVLVVCNGGTMDAQTIVDRADWKRLVDLADTPEISLRDSYDAVFVLNSDGADNDPALCAWAGHPHLRVVPGAAEARDAALTAEVEAFLGVPEPLEIERKYLIEYPDMDWLKSQEACRPVEIAQAYLTRSDGTDVRVRQRGTDGGYIYIETIKRGGPGIERTEIERRITAEEYRSLLEGAKGDVRWIRKTRYCLVYRGQYLEIDIFPFWDSKAFLEVELLSKDQPVEIPPEIHVIREVTGDPQYTNYALARRDGAAED